MLARLGTDGRTPIHILNEMIEGKGVCVGGGGGGGRHLAKPVEKREDKRALENGGVE
jgi:hypothetical protein